MSYQGESADKDKVVNALGGKKGLIDSGLPSLVFLVVFNLSDKNINTAIWAALTLSIVLTLLRLIKRETLQHAFSGLVGVGICALISRRSGNAADFYLPGLWINAGYRGELQVILINHDLTQPVSFKKGDRIAQLVIQKVERAQFVEVENLPGSERSADGFGSTGK